MPLSLVQSQSFTLDKVKISRFDVTVQDNFTVVRIHYSIGYEDESGNFVAKEFSRVDIPNVEFDANLYENVKTKLYELLDSKVNAAGDPEQPQL
jgi:hypothetical protein